jgi:hypothetical protein
MEAPEDDEEDEDDEEEAEPKEESQVDDLVAKMDDIKLKGN